MDELKELVRRRVDVVWDEWAERHPHLAAAIDRVWLVEATVAELRRDPSYVEAMRRAGLDERQLAAVERVLELVEGAVWRAIGLP